MAKVMTAERIPMYVGSSESLGNQPWIVREGLEVMAPGAEIGKYDDGLPIYKDIDDGECRMADEQGAVDMRGSG